MSIRSECPAPKTYYASYSPYGVKVVYNEYNPPTVFRFLSKRDRDRFVEKGNRNYEAITRKEADRLSKPWQRLEVYPDGYILDYFGIAIKEPNKNVKEGAYASWQNRIDQYELNR